MAQQFEHCKLEGTRIRYLGSGGVFEINRAQSTDSFWAWHYLEKEGWELVSVLIEGGEQVAYFKRPVGL